MAGKDARGSDRNSVVRHSIDYLRKRSLRRIWWNSARVALMREHSGEPPHQPYGHRAAGKRV